jgi:putative two-component system response regulator
MVNLPRLLVIDDDKDYLRHLTETVRWDGMYQVLAADNGMLGIQMARENLPDLIICDVVMPPPDGWEVFKELAKSPATAAIPFIFLTGSSDQEDIAKGMDLGADDYITKPFSKADLLRRIRALLRRREITEAHVRLKSEDEINALGAKVRELLHRFSNDHTGMAEAMAQMLSLRDAETAEHARRVVELSDRVARKLGITGRPLHHIRLGALLHDVGKVGVPDAILLKKGSQTDEERRIMMTHTALGRKILEPMGLPPAVIELVYYHHERWDGSGYPDGLDGENIPLPARIFAIVDVWDALTTERPYRRALPFAKVVSYLEEQAGSHFDPKIVGVFLSIVKKRHSSYCSRAG